MNAVEKAVRHSLGNAEDNLARAKMQERADPTWRSGNDESIQEVVASYQAHADKIRADAKAAGIKL